MPAADCVTETVHGGSLQPGARVYREEGREREKNEREGAMRREMERFGGGVHL